MSTSQAYQNFSRRAISWWRSFSMAWVWFILLWQASTQLKMVRPHQ